MKVDPMGVLLVALLIVLVVAGALGLWADSRDGADGSGALGRRHHQSWTWW
jgi:hypothetical protein